MNLTPELLAPAGNAKNLEYALAFGADAVYAGQPRYSLRVRNNDFDLENLARGIALTQSRNKKFFLAANVLPHNSKVKTFIADLEPVIAMKPDALIMADPGLIMLVRERWPDMAIHLSVQANTVNYAAVRFWGNIGIKRIILSRELSIEEIAEIRQQCPDMELEVFVHGALCIAYSGRCLLSGYINHRDPNQGTCTNACRWEYKVKPESISVTNPAAEPLSTRPPISGLVLEETTRPGQYMPIEEDEHGTYIMNSKDLRAVEHVHRLVQIGVNSFKIEGRTKSPYYVARTTQVYRRAIDDALAGRPFDPALLGALESVASRGYTDGFYQRHHDHEYQNYMTGVARQTAQQYVGDVVQYDSVSGLGEIASKNAFALGDVLELITPQGNQSFTVQKLMGHHGEPLDRVPGSDHRVRLAMPNPLSFPSLLAKHIQTAPATEPTSTRLASAG